MDQIYRNLELIANLKISNFKTKPDNIRYKLCTIYVLRNKINGKVYIGQTYKSPKDRWSDHKSQAITKSTKGYFQKAICKYSWESFDKYVIWQCECDVLDSKWILNKCRSEHISVIKCFSLPPNKNTSPTVKSNSSLPTIYLPLPDITKESSHSVW